MKKITYYKQSKKQFMEVIVNYAGLGNQMSRYALYLSQKT